MPRNSEYKTLTDPALKEEANDALNFYDGSMRDLAEELDVAASSLSEALATQGGRLRKLRMRVVEHVKGGSLASRTIIHWDQ